jgi:cell division transport system permease protein
MRALRYAVEEAAASLWRGRQSGLLSTATIALALSVLGGFLLVTLNLERLASEWSRAAEMSVYLADGVSAEERAAIEERLAPGSVVAEREYVSKSDALERFRQTFGDMASAIGGLEGNPLPASYEVRVRATGEARAGVDGLADELRRMPGVADVRYDQEWLTRLLAAVDIVRGVGLLLGAVLTIAAALTVANVVRLALYARRDELEIMHLVGAPEVFVRGPFVVEGLLQGGAGALVALAALAIGFWAVRARYLEPLASAVNLSGMRFLPIELCLLLVVGGMAVGCLGGMVAAWQRQAP